VPNEGRGDDFLACEIAVLRSSPNPDRLSDGGLDVGGQEVQDERAIQHRIYDALNVWMAAGLIVQAAGGRSWRGGCAPPPPPVSRAVA
jgi:hypothetical protein